MSNIHRRVPSQVTVNMMLQAADTKDTRCKCILANSIALAARRIKSKSLGSYFFLLNSGKRINTGMTLVIPASGCMVGVQL